MEQLAFLEIVKLIKGHDDAMRWFREATAGGQRKKYSDVFDHMIQRLLESA
jgi:hypothetical protein